LKVGKKFNTHVQSSAEPTTASKSFDYRVTNILDACDVDCMEIQPNRTHTLLHKKE